MFSPKSDGTTKSERYLASRCNDTFLGLWSYPNVFRDQDRHANGDGKELCDLLVVCGRDVIIFSDKRCRFQSSVDTATAWRRWYKRAIEASASQIYGAERWLRSFPSKVFLDRKCTVQVPNLVTSMEHARVHRVIVASGVTSDCQRAFARSGSLRLQPSIVGKGHYDTPFTVGRLNGSRGFIHAFDEVTLDVILGELDTVTDFIDYLDKKERWIAASHLAYADGEENLLALYLRQVGPDEKHDIILPDGYSSFAAKDGLWQRHLLSNQYANQKVANEASYLWDKIIQEFSGHALGGTLCEGSLTSLEDNERLARILARESRHSRRVLSAAMLDLVKIVKDGSIAVRTVVSDGHPTTAYVMVITPFPGDDYDVYRNCRMNYTAAYCKAVALKLTHLEQVVGIATEASTGDGYSVDICLELPKTWSSVDREEATRIVKQANVFQKNNLTTLAVHSDEYPVLPGIQITSLAQGANTKTMSRRNSLCPCRSGRKYKKCCGRKY